jgi:hypothetical protein
MKQFLIPAAMIILTLPAGDKLTGRWQSLPSPKGNVTGVLFKPDNTFEGYINKKPFVTGSYTFEDSIFSFVDNGCEGRRGIYKIVFFSNEDSMRFVPVSDSCDERRNGMSRLVMGRVR